MKTVIAYQTSDGELFTKKGKASKHQKILDIKEKIYQLLGGDIDPNSCDFANGDGYYQVTKSNYKKALKLIQKLKVLTDTPLNYSITSRYCYENSDTTLIASLMHCIDETTLRIYGQPYYRMNPSKCKSQKDWSQK